MKTFILGKYYTGLYLSVFLLFCSLLTGIASVAQALDSDPAKLVTTVLEQKNDLAPVLPQGTSSQWYQQAIASLEAREYFFEPFEKTGLYSAANHSQRLGFLFKPSGYTVKNIAGTDSKEEAWEYHFSLQQVGKESALRTLPCLQTKNYSEQSLQYSYNNFTIEYFNDKKGMRQNFIINQQPAGNGKLEIVIKLSGDLRPSVPGNEQLVLSSGKDSNQVKLAYDNLKVWDANHQLLPATMKLQGKNKLIISVDDKDAVYPVTVDPLNHLPDWTANGNGLLFPLLNDLTTPVMYGYSVAGAGDLNGDGYGDIIIGAPLYVKILSIPGNSFSPVNVGAAFIYMGSSAGPAITPSEALQPSTVASALAGFSVSSAGDINGDGKSEVMLSAPGDKISLTVAGFATSVSTGKVYIYNGSLFDGNVNTISTPMKTLSLSQPDFGLLAILPANPLYGFSISQAGDVNGDGYADIVIGSPAYLDLLSGTLGGKVDIYNGSSSGLSSTPSKTIKAGLLNGLFGFSVASAGKVNNDIYSDIIVGAPASASALAIGSAFVFHGSASGITATMASGANTILQTPGLLNSTLFGFSVAGAGDVNGDGYGDVIVGEPLSLETTLALQVVAVGKAHVYYGSSTGIKTTGGTDLTSPRSPNLLGLVQGNLLYGYSVGSAGDMNCDGIADVVVGEPGGTAISLGTGALGLVSTNALSGSAYIYSGNPTTGPANIPMTTINETSAVSVANLIGYNVGLAGDVNGDGHPDLIIGAPNGTLSLSSSLTGIVGNAIGYLTTNSVGSAYVYYGCNFSLLPVRLLNFTGKEQYGGGLLNWVVTGSEANDYFDVERSVNGVSFIKIGIVQAVPAKGGTQELYTYTDGVLPSENNYYRLKMINAATGKFNYSKAVLIKGKGSAAALNIAPNPARETVQLHFNNMPAGNYTLLMSNAGGQTTLRKNIVLTSSIYEMQTIDRGTSMASGIYIIRLIDKSGQTISTSKIMLQ